MPARRGTRSTKRRSVAEDRTGNLLDVTAKLRTAPCVPALREAVKAWRAGGYKGTTETTKRLLAFWFESDHRLATGARFKYHEAQRVAIETLIFVWEYERVRSRTALLERYAIDVDGVPLFADAFARYAVKMATGSGKTKVMALAVAWQFLNAQREAEDVAKQYARTFLLIAPNVIVLQRLATDFAGGRIFQPAGDPVVPRDLRVFWEFDCVMRGDGEKAHAEGTLFVTNIDQLYDREARGTREEPGAMTAVLGPRQPTNKLDLTDFRERVGLRDGLLMVLNDEAHHTHDEQGEWSKVIRALHERTSLNMQVDFSATPRLRNGALFPWIISDYPLKQAILDQIVKRPMRGLARVQEARSAHASIRYEGYLVAGVERWKEYVEQLKPTGKRPILFIMLTSTDDADDVAEWIRGKYPGELGGERTLVIHTNASGEVTKNDLDQARRVAREVDAETSQVGAIVSVLMLREGWDVQNVTVVVGLRPFTARANILPEQAIGRGLRLMFRGQPGAGYKERVDIIGNDKFLEFVDELEKIEEMKFDTFDPTKDRLHILTIAPVPEHAEFDLGVPVLSPVLVRKKTLAEEIAGLDVMAFQLPEFTIRLADDNPKTFTYEGFDVVTDAKELERQYTIPEPQTAQEVIGFYSRRIAEQVKLPSQFAAIAPKVREFFEHRLFGERVDLEDRKVIRVMAMPLVQHLAVRTFAKALRTVAVAELEPQVLAPARLLSTCAPFPWSQSVYEAGRTVFNLVACDNAYETAFARFLDKAPDVAAFAKLPMRFAFAIEYLDDSGNLRLYHPDWIARADDGTMYLLETKGYVGAEVAQKDRAATIWCENATALSVNTWRYRRVDQREFEKLGPQHLSDLAALLPGGVWTDGADAGRDRR
jgi:type III restriction enzyme